MPKRITDSQLLGELGEAAARKRFLEIGFQFDVRSRLEAGIDAIAEVMVNGSPLAKMIAVQVKATEAAKYTAESDQCFTYLLRPDDLKYWRNSNLPVIVVLYRRSDETFYWKSVQADFGPEERRLTFDKSTDILNRTAANRLAALTVPKAGQGYYVPPLGGGEEAVVNMLPITLPSEIYVCSTPYNVQRAMAVLLDSDDSPRFDWIIKDNTFWSFHDPLNSSVRDIVDIDQVEAIETNLLSQHEDIDEQNSFAFLLSKTLQHQVNKDLRWEKERKLFYFRAIEPNRDRMFLYQSSINKAVTTVVNVTMQKKDADRVAFVRHHAFIPRFERMLDQWYLIISPTYYFTTNGFIPHSYPDALLSGKKRLDNNAALRGQVIMWHRFLTHDEVDANDLFAVTEALTQYITFGPPPVVALPTSVPEDAWATPVKKAEARDMGAEFDFDGI